MLPRVSWSWCGIAEFGGCHGELALVGAVRLEGIFGFLAAGVVAVQIDDLAFGLPPGIGHGLLEIVHGKLTHHVVGAFEPERRVAVLRGLRYGSALGSGRRLRVLALCEVIRFHDVGQGIVAVEFPTALTFGNLPRRDGNVIILVILVEPGREFVGACDTCGAAEGEDGCKAGHETDQDGGEEAQAAFEANHDKPSEKENPAKNTLKTSAGRLIV